MLRMWTKPALAGVLGLMAVVLAGGAGGVRAEDKKEEKVPTVKEIMQKGHKGTDAYIGKLKKLAKDEKWDDAKEISKTLAFFGENIGKNKPTKGDADSWEKLSKKYAESTKAAHKAVEDKDAKGLDKALNSINCMECHKVHR